MDERLATVRLYDGAGNMVAFELEDQDDALELFTVISDDYTPMSVTVELSGGPFSFHSWSNQPVGEISKPPPRGMEGA